LRRTHIRWLHGALAAALILGSCTAGSNDGAQRWPSLQQAAAEFFGAWRDGDHAAMNEAMDTSSALLWNEAALDKLMRSRLRAGAVTSFTAAPGEVEQPADDAFEAAGAREDPQPLDADVPYRVTYESAASTAPIELAGALGFSFDAEAEEWRAGFDEDALWPGIEGAAGFKVTTRWPKRGAILDRSRKRLAAGPAGKRRYPFGSVGGSTIGHIETVTKDTLAEHEGAAVGDLVGGSGLEEGLDDRLAGEPESQLIVVDGKGSNLEIVGGRDAVPGENVKVTIDIDVQRAAETAYGSTAGGAAVIDPRTGDVLAAVASGPFDPNGYVGAAGVEPFNRALVGRYPPGSAMKVVTASAALEAGVVTPSTTVTGPQEYKGVRNFESGEFGSISFATATQQSVNTAFAQVAEKLGARRMTRFAEAFGFNRVPDMPVEAAEPSFPPLEGLGDLMWASIGQAQVLATPLQMATVAGTIANDGKRMEPRIVGSDPKTGDRVVSRRTAREVTALMRAVVVGGTGTAANISGLDVAGKTGTAEVDVDGERKNHAWFICFAPAGNPKLAVAVVSEYGGVGGQVAAPLARQILQAVAPLIR
jgi:penicillin-binding protein A